MNKRKKYYVLISATVLIMLLAVAVSAVVMQQSKRVQDPYFMNQEAIATRVLKEFCNKSDIHLSYKMSEELPFGTVDYYLDSQGNEYLFDEEGALLSFEPTETGEVFGAEQNLIDLASVGQKQLTEEQIKIVAAQYANDLYGEEFSVFEFSNVFHDVDCDNYTIEYRVLYEEKYIGELCIVTIRSDGTLEHITRPLQSQLKGFDPALLESVGDEVLNEFIDQDVHRQFVEGSFTYTVNKLAIREQNEQLGIMAFVTVYPSDGTGSTGVEVFYPLES